MIPVLFRRNEMCIRDSINTPASPERLAQLRERVQNGTYYIPTDRLTGVLMQRWFGL